jgi:hypothetical protein
MLLFYLLCAGSGCAALASIWYSLLQDAPRFFLSLATALLCAMLSEIHYRWVTEAE